MKKLYAKIILFFIRPALDLELKRSKVPINKQQKAETIITPSLGISDNAQRLLKQIFETRKNPEIKELPNSKLQDMEGRHLPSGNLNFGDRLKIVREKRKLTRNEVAIRIGVNYNTIYYYEKGLSTPPPQRMLSLCKALDVSEDFLNGKITEFN
jgi:DNA-binding XRE family transcriptional regulator